MESLTNKLHNLYVQALCRADPLTGVYAELIDAVEVRDVTRASGLVVMNGLPDDLGREILRVVN